MSFITLSSPKSCKILKEGFFNMRGMTVIDDLVESSEENLRERNEGEEYDATLKDYLLAVPPALAAFGQLRGKRQAPIARDLGLPDNIWTIGDCVGGTGIAMGKIGGSQVGEALSSGNPGWVALELWGLYDIANNSMRFAYTMATGKPIMSFSPGAVGKMLAWEGLHYAKNEGPAWLQEFIENEEQAGRYKMRKYKVGVDMLVDDVKHFLPQAYDSLKSCYNALISEPGERHLEEEWTAREREVMPERGTQLLNTIRAYLE